MNGEDYMPQTERKPGRVEREIKVQQQELTELENYIGNLDSILHSVMIGIPPQAPNVKEGGAVVGREPSPLSDQIAEANQRIMIIKQRVVHILERLDL